MSVTAEVKEMCARLTEEELMLLELSEKKRRITSYRGKKSVTGYASTLSPKCYTATYADSTKDAHDTLALASISIIRSRTWIVNSGASHHVTGVAGEFSSYTCLTVIENIQTIDGMALR
jgi:hypothetical protein